MESFDRRQGLPGLIYRKFIEPIEAFQERNSEYAHALASGVFGEQWPSADTPGVSSRSKRRSEPKIGRFQTGAQYANHPPSVAPQMRRTVSSTSPIVGLYRAHFEHSIPRPDTPVTVRSGSECCKM
jgi:hypothetical protein